MASLIRDKDGTRRCQFVLGGKRYTIRLGRTDARSATAFTCRIESLIASRRTGVLDASAAEWLEGLDDELHAKLANSGLVRPRAHRQTTLATLLEAYFANLDVKASTRRTYEQTREGLTAHFGEEMLLMEFGELRAQEWRRAMVKDKLAEATIAKRVKTARAIFAAGVRWKMLKENPFLYLKAGSMRNPSRLVIVPAADVEKVIDQCTDPQWRALLALARYGGLRVPSEALRLEWGHINWENNRVLVTSPKTEGQGKATRLIPLFPELKTHLLAAYEAAPEGSTHVITLHRDAGVNLRTQLERLIDRAGLQPWPKLWQNLRASRATELARDYPGHVAAAWCGHTEAVALASYWKVRDDDYERAVVGSQKAGASEAPEPASNGGV